MGVFTRRLMAVLSLLFVAGLAVALSACVLVDDGMGISGEDPVALAELFGRKAIAHHNAITLGSDWHLTRVLETSSTPGVEPPPDSEERAFVIGAARDSGASAGKEVGQIEVWLVRRHGDRLWRARRSAQDAVW